MRLLELYESIQGEGPHVGEPTIFVRFAGCNLRCPGWPCDTPNAIFPNLWKDQAPKEEPLDIFQKIMWKVMDTNIHRLCITGGEPLTQPVFEQQILFEMLPEAIKIDLFTNGTIIFPDWVTSRDGVSVMMDWKLNGSGEGYKAIENRLINASMMGSMDGIKFVVKDNFDLDQAYGVWRTYREVREQNIWVTPAWGHMEPHDLVAEVLRRQLPWRVSVQVHKYIWSAEERFV